MAFIAEGSNLWLVQKLPSLSAPSSSKDLFIGPFFYHLYNQFASQHASFSAYHLSSRRLQCRQAHCDRFLLGHLLQTRSRFRLLASAPGIAIAGTWLYTDISSKTAAPAMTA
jgi:hypothetical protein